MAIIPYQKEWHLGFTGPTRYLSNGGSRAIEQYDVS